MPAHSAAGAPIHGTRRTTAARAVRTNRAARRRSAPRIPLDPGLDLRRAASGSRFPLPVRAATNRGSSALTIRPHRARDAPRPDAGRLSSRNTPPPTTGHLVGLVRMLVRGDAGTSPTVLGPRVTRPRSRRDVHYRAFPSHPRGEGFHFIERNSRMITNSTFGRAPRRAVLNPVTFEPLNMPAVHPYREVHVQNPLRVLNHVANVDAQIPVHPPRDRNSPWRSRKPSSLLELRLPFRTPPFARDEVSPAGVWSNSFPKTTAIK